MWSTASEPGQFPAKKQFSKGYMAMTQVYVIVMLLQHMPAAASKYLLSISLLFYRFEKWHIHAR